MAMTATGELGYTCTLDGAAINFSGSSQALVERMVGRLSKLLGKKGIMLTQSPAPGIAALHLRVVQIEQGNQLMRYLLPFLSPAVVELEAELSPPGGKAEPLYYRQTAQVGLFGGSAAGMLGVCVDRIATKLSKDILRRIT